MRAGVGEEIVEVVSVDLEGAVGDRDRVEHGPEPHGYPGSSVTAQTLYSGIFATGSRAPIVSLLAAASAK